MDDISARMEEEGEPLDAVLTLLDCYAELSGVITQVKKSKVGWNTGTAIRIGFLRDDWTRGEVNHLNKTLGVLIPPVEQKELNLYLFDASDRELYGSVSSDILEDFDYKVEADMTTGEEIAFNIFRNELDSRNIDAELFKLEEMKEAPFGENDFKEQKISYRETMEELFPGEDERFFRQIRELGPLKVQLLFFKKGSPSRRDAEVYPYRPFQPGPRQAWLDEFGGIKIYRDNFAVRPYGELSSRAFDWLALGRRVAISPVAASRKGWKVSPQNLAGTVMISRAANARLYDQTKREGIIENDHFAAFRTVILRVIREFEDDRSHIHYNLNELYKRKHKSEVAKEKGEIAATHIVRHPERATAEDAQQLAHAVRCPAGGNKGTQRRADNVASALQHWARCWCRFRMRWVNCRILWALGRRSWRTFCQATSLRDEMVDVPSAFHPYGILEEWEDDDRRVKQWFTFALTTIRAGAPAPTGSVPSRALERHEVGVGRTPEAARGRAGD